MNSKWTVFSYRGLRQALALTLSVTIIPLAQLDLFAQAPAFVPLDAVQLDQLVAPIALYPDSLVAQILTASTYPDQVTQANAWSQRNLGLPPQQRADLANGVPWDPSVKALTAFPSVLDNMARNYSWTQQLGNVYYNQPGDLMNAIQAMRYQAQQSGRLLSTPQQRVYSENGEILIAPVNPALVYVPYYNPWRIWGPTFVAYPGFYVLPPPPGLVLGLGIGFAVGISIGLFAHYGWGWHAWSPGWHSGIVVFNHNTYISRSVTVNNYGHYGGYNRGVFEHEGHGVPGGFHAPGTREGFARAEAHGGVGRPEGHAAGRPEARAGGARPLGARPEGAHPGASAPRAGAGNQVAGGHPGGGAPAGRTGGAPAGRPGGAAGGGHPGGGAAPAAHAAPGGSVGHGPAGGGGHPGGGGGGAHPAASGGNSAPVGHPAPQGGGGGGGHHK
ncbi:MAG TPA: DUF3300 domain-containing protein [Bryobacteraceae bacterium]|nr:DUF3300 domain-containing protein [Bryobacteraceae bacterium]